MNLTFDSGAKASDISKSAATPTVYTAPISNIVNISSNSTYNLDSTGPSSYKANLIFKGANAVSGNTLDIKEHYDRWAHSAPDCIPARAEESP